MKDPFDEFSSWYEFACKEGSLQSEKDRLLTMPTLIPSERESQKRQLKEIDKELDALRHEMARYEISTNKPEKSKNATAARPMPWISEAKQIARELLNNSPKLNNRPIAFIASKVHEVMVERRITGRGGRIPSAESIKRHALSGIKSRNRDLV